MLLDSLIDSHGDPAEIVSVCSAMTARLRAPDEQIMRINALANTADELLTRDLELEAAVGFAEDAQEIGRVRGADAKEQADLDRRVAQARRAGQIRK